MFKRIINSKRENNIMAKNGELVSVAMFNISESRVELLGFDWKREVKNNKLDIYHHNDMDGRGAAAIIASTSNINNRMIEVNYNTVTVENSIPTDHANYCIIVDYSANTKDLRKALDTYDKVLWLDHHASSLVNIFDISDEFSAEITNGKFTAIIDNTRSGALIACEYFIGKEIASAHRVASLIDDYDRWIKQTDLESDYLNQFVYNTSAFTDPNANIWQQILFTPQYLTTALEYGKRLYDAYSLINSIKYDAYTYEAEFEGLKIRVYEGYANSQLFGEHIHEYDAVAVLHKAGDKWQFSLYTTKDGIDLSAICSKYNGGGHKKAAGGTSVEKPF